jgi:hypothetical protein
MPTVLLCPIQHVQNYKNYCLRGVPASSRDVKQPSSLQPSASHEGGTFHHSEWKVWEHTSTERRNTQHTSSGLKCFLQVYIVLQPRLPTSTSSRHDNLISANKTTFFHLYRTTQLCFFTESTEDGRGRVRQWLRVVNWRQRAWNSCSLFQELSLYPFRKPEETHGRLKTFWLKIVLSLEFVTVKLCQAPLRLSRTFKACFKFTNICIKYHSDSQSPTFYGNQRFITVFTTAGHWFVYSMSWHQSAKLRHHLSQWTPPAYRQLSKLVSCILICRLKHCLYFSSSYALTALIRSA